MAYQLDDIRLAAFPDQETVELAMVESGVPLASVEAAVRRFVCSEGLIAGFGYQQSIADHLEVHLRRELGVPPLRSLNPAVSPTLNEKADLRLSLDDDTPGVYVEIEFRPNVEKDFVKFQIAHNQGRLAIAVLIVALSRAKINASYTTMPEFDKVARIVAELRPPYPLLLVGIAGAHVATAAA